MDSITSLFKKSFETLKRFPQLFAFPALCWIVGLVFQSVLGGVMLRAMLRGYSLSWAAFGMATFAGVIVQCIVQLVAAYFSAGQIKGLFLADEGTALTPARFTDACKKYGSRVLTAKLLRVGLYLGIGIIGALLAYILSVLGTLLAALAAGAVALLTMFWEIIIVRDDAQVQPALAASCQVVAKNLIPICVPLIIVGIAESIITSICGSAAAISSLINQVLVAPFAGLVMINLLQQVKTGQSTISG